MNQVTRRHWWLAHKGLPVTPAPDFRTETDRRQSGHAVNGAGVNFSAVPGTHIIDVGDMSKFASNGYVTAQGMMGHEIKEGFEIQTKGLTTAAQIGPAHSVKAIGAENAINGNTRITTPGVADFVGNTLTLKLSAPNGSGGVTPVTVTATFTNGNVTSVTGNTKPIH